MDKRSGTDILSSDFLDYLQFFLLIIKDLCVLLDNW